ncbi:hypothetical protein [Saccharicrinis aurantiacus]|uniref:hypothetical protein n=1 Tax=Saccharicrinis aurantiacus TaxID=1849719 RepID=UPI0008394C81|nr:hypothetical protein [Saccharicrinis aurantiacus]
MSKYSNKYITSEEFEVLVGFGSLYEGFVEGVGYAFISSGSVPPPNDVSWPNAPAHIPYTESYTTTFFIQKVDTSEEMRILSLKHKIAAQNRNLPSNTKDPNTGWVKKEDGSAYWGDKTKLKEGEKFKGKKGYDLEYTYHEDGSKSAFTGFMLSDVNVRPDEGEVVARSVNHSMNTEGVKVVAITICVPLAIIAAAEAAPLLYQGGKNIGTLGMRKLADYQYWNGNLIEQANIIYYGVGAKLGSQGVDLIKDALPILYEEVSTEFPGVSPNQVPMQILKSTLDAMNDELIEIYHNEQIRHKEKVRK